MSIKEKVTQLESYDLDHLGIAPRIIAETELVETINEKLGTYSQEKINLEHGTQSIAITNTSLEVSYSAFNY